MDRNLLSKNRHETIQLTRKNVHIPGHPVSALHFRKLISPLSANVKQSALCLIGKLRLFEKVSMWYKLLRGHIFKASFFMFMQPLCDSVRKLFYSSGNKLQSSEFPMATLEIPSKAGIWILKFRLPVTHSNCQMTLPPSPTYRVTKYKRENFKWGEWTFTGTSKKQIEADPHSYKLLAYFHISTGLKN